MRSDKWEKLLDEWEASGMDLDRWAIEKKLNPSAVRRWQRTLRGDGAMRTAARPSAEEVAADQLTVAVIDALATADATVDELAEQLSCPTQQLEVELRDLEKLGLLVRDGEHWQLG